MVALESLKKLGITDYQIDKWVKSCYVYVEKDNVDIICEDVYCLCMVSVLTNHIEMYDEFINESYNPTLIQYHQFLRMILDGKLEESQPLMRTILKDENFMDEYEEILLFVSIIEEYKLRDLYIPEEDNILVKKQISLFKKYLLSFNYPMAKEFLQVIRKTHDCLEYKVMAAILDSKVDTINYILKSDIYPSKVTNDNLKRMEREILLYLELGDYDTFLQRIGELNYIYQNQDCKCFEIMISLVNAINAMQHNRQNVSSRSLFVLRGDFNSVLIALLSCRDYYRVHDLIEQEIRDSEGFDLYLAVLFILIHAVMYLNQYNMNFIDGQMKSNNCSLVENLLPPKATLSKIEGSVIKGWEERFSTQEKDKINYYKMYLDAYKDGDYELAKDYLKRFCEKISAFNMGPNYDYLFTELEYLIDKTKDNVMRPEALKYYNQSLKLMEMKNFKAASEMIVKWRDSISYFHPRAQALLAKCYYKMGFCEEALELYEGALKYYLYPADYEDIIMILYSLGRYDKIENYFDKRENYDYASLKVYYVMSLVAIKQHNYGKAKEMLEKSQKVSMEVYDIVPDYSQELEIIERMMRGECVDLYTLDDYIEYEIVEEDLQVLEEINRNRELYKDDFITVMLLDITSKKAVVREKIEYLLSIVKILKREKIKVNFNPIYEYVEYLIAKANLEPSDIKRFTLTMKNYQNI